MTIDRGALAELQAAFGAAGQMPQGTMTHEQWKVFARLYNAAERVAHPMSAVPVEGDTERKRVEQSNDVAGVVFDQVKKAWPDLHPVLDLRYGIADALWERGYRRSSLPVEGEVEWRRISPKGTPVTWPLKTHPGEEPGWTVERRAVVRGPWEVVPDAE